MRTVLRRFDSLAVRTIVVVLLGIGLVYLASLWTYQAALQHEVTVANDTRLADRLIALKRTIIRTEPDEREMVAHDLSGGPIEAHWSKESHASPGGPGSEEWQGLEGRLKSLVPEIADGGIVVGANRTSADDPHLALISMRLPDQSWINVSLVSLNNDASAGHGTLLSTSLMALGAIFISVILVRWIGRPLSVFAAAASNVYRGTETALVAEDGPSEVKALATAFNEMQRRIKKMIDDRTNALAAVSHDLRTPLTRLRLRTEDIADSEARAAVSADLDTMERMIDQTLQFLRGDKAGEVVQNVDLAAIIQTIVDDFADGGASIVFKSPGRAALEGRHLTLRRCFENIIGNALKYGVDTTVAISLDKSTAVVTVADRGPGIADADKARVFAPFMRLENSRNSDTGGFGLGLAIAKQAVEAHGGTIDLTDQQPCGLLVTVRLPLKSRAEAAELQS